MVSLEIAFNTHERGFTIPKAISHCKKWKIWNILCLQASNLAPKTVVRRAWSCRITVVLFWTKCAIRNQIKPGILYLIIKRDQSNFNFVFIWDGGEDKGYFPVASLGQLSFDCRTYCGLSRRMQGWPFSLPVHWSFVNDRSWLWSHSHPQIPLSLPKENVENIFKSCHKLFVWLRSLTFLDLFDEPGMLVTWW